MTTPVTVKGNLHVTTLMVGVGGQNATMENEQTDDYPAQDYMIHNTASITVENTSDETKGTASVKTNDFPVHVVHGENVIVVEPNSEHTVTLSGKGDIAIFGEMAAEIAPAEGVA